MNGREKKKKNAEKKKVGPSGRKRPIQQAERFLCQSIEMEMEEFNGAMMMECSADSQRDVGALFNEGTMGSKSRVQHGSYSKVPTFSKIYSVSDCAAAALFFCPPEGSLNHILCSSDRSAEKLF